MKSKNWINSARYGLNNTAHGRLHKGDSKTANKLEVQKFDFECNYEFRLSMLHSAHILTVLLH